MDQYDTVKIDREVMGHMREWSRQTGKPVVHLVGLILGQAIGHWMDGRQYQIRQAIQLTEGEEPEKKEAKKAKEVKPLKYPAPVDLVADDPPEEVSEPEAPKAADYSPEARAAKAFFAQKGRAHKSAAELELFVKKGY